MLSKQPDSCERRLVLSRLYSAILIAVSVRPAVDGSVRDGRFHTILAELPFQEQPVRTDPRVCGLDRITTLDKLISVASHLMEMTALKSSGRGVNSRCPEGKEPLQWRLSLQTIQSRSDPNVLGLVND